MQKNERFYLFVFVLFRRQIVRSLPPQIQEHKASLGYRETVDRIAWPLRTVHSPSHIKTLKKREVETRSHAKNAQARKGALLRRGEEDVQLCWQANQIYPHFNASSGSNNGVSPHCTVIPIKNQDQVSLY